MEDNSNNVGIGRQFNHESLEAKKNAIGVSEDRTQFEDALKLTGVGKYNYRLLAISIYSLLAATAEMFTMGLVTTSSQCDLNLDVAKKGLLSSIPILGVVVSAHFWGFLADTRGRRFALIISTSATCVAGVTATFANNWIFLAVIKFIGATFASGTNALIFTFLGEGIIAQRRQTFVMFASAGVLSFQLVNAILAYPILNATFSYDMPLLGYSFRPWRLFLLVIGVLSGINMLLIVFFTYESPKFYFAIGEHEKGLKNMQKIYAVNTGNAVESYSIKHVILNDDDYKTKRRSFFRSVWDQTIPLFNKKYITKTILIFLCGLPSYCISPPISIWLPFIFNSYSQTQDSNITFCDIFLKNETHATNTSLVPACDDRVADVTLIAIAGFAVYLTLSSLITVMVIKLIGKKWTFVTVHFFTFIMCAIINRLDILYGIIAMIGMSANVVCMGIVTTYAVELFPTYMRAMAVCLCILFGRAVSIVFYNIIGAQLENNCDNFVMILAGVLLFGGIAGLFLPSDKQPKNVENVEATEKTKS